MPFAVVGRGELSVPASINDDMRLLPCLYMYSEIGGPFFAASDEKRVHVHAFIRMLSLSASSFPSPPAMHDDKFIHATLKWYRSLKLKLTDLLTNRFAPRDGGLRGWLSPSRNLPADLPRFWWRPE